MFLVSKYTLSEPSITKKTNNKYANLTFDLMVAIFKNDRRNIHVLISEFLIHVEKQCWCLNIHFLGQGLQKKTIINT